MTFTLAKSLVSLIPFFYHANCAPLQQRGVLGERALTNYQETPKLQDATIPMDGINWSKFGIASKDPTFDNFLVTATGLQAEVALSVDKQNGIYIADHLSRVRELSPDDHLSALIKTFITNGGSRPNLRFLAIPNIVQEDTKEQKDAKKNHNTKTQ